MPEISSPFESSQGSGRTVPEVSAEVTAMPWVYVSTLMPSAGLQGLMQPSGFDFQQNHFQLFGLAHTKTVLVEGEYKTVNSRPLTVEQNKIRKQLSISKFREFALDLGNVDSARVNGETLELVPAAQ